MLVAGYWPYCVFNTLYCASNTPYFCFNTDHFFLDAAYFFAMVLHPHEIVSVGGAGLPFARLGWAVWCGALGREGGDSAHFTHFLPYYAYHRT